MYSKTGGPFLSLRSWGKAADQSINKSIFSGVEHRWDVQHVGIFVGQWRAASELTGVCGFVQLVLKTFANIDEISAFSLWFMLENQRSLISLLVETVILNWHRFQIEIYFILCGVLSHVSVVFRLKFVKVWAVTQTEHVDIGFPALKLCDFRYSGCVLNSVAALKKVGPNSIRSLPIWLLTLGRTSEVFKASTTASALQFCISRNTNRCKVSIKHNIG